MGRLSVAFVLFVVSFLTACSPTADRTPATLNPTLASMNTAAVQTVAIKMLRLTLSPETAIQPVTPATPTLPHPNLNITSTQPQDQVIESTVTVTSSPLPNLAVPCNKAEFLGDVTIPDGTILPPGFTFTKTWRLRNIGSCIWSRAYHIIYVQGTPLGTTGDFPLQIDVPPGADVQISLPLQAPMHNGLSETYWKMRSPDGQVFGIGENSEDPLWVKIIVDGAQENIQEQPQDTPIVSPLAPERCSPLGDPSFERKLFTLINGERTKQGLYLLFLSPQLTQLARAHSRDMAIYNYVDHYNSDGDGLAERLNKNHISSAVFSENFFHSENPNFAPEHVEEAWISSETDRTNILNVTFSHIGIGYMVCNTDPKEYYVTAIFSLPK